MASAVSLSVSGLFLLVTLCLGQGVYNVAPNKTYSQSSYHILTPDASKAANGDTSGRLSNNSCIHTDQKDTFPSWQVDLGGDYPILNITLYGRTGYSHRLSSVTVKVDDHECTKIDDDPQSTVLHLSCHQTLYGRKVNITRKYNNSLTNEENVINICEVQIWVCSAGYYGDKCDQRCEHCKYNACSRYSGQCRDGACNAGYTSDTCTHKCGTHAFGENCNSSCGQCKDHETCHYIDGICTQGCAPGWTQPTCHEKCPGGFFGDNCSHECGHCFNGSHCHHQTGICATGCAPGYKGRTCECGRFSTTGFLGGFAVLCLCYVREVCDACRQRRSHGGRREANRGQESTQTGNSLQAGPYTVSLTDKRHLATCLTGYSITWQRRLESGGVQLTYYNDWHEDIPVNTCDLVYLLNTFTT